MRWINSIEHNGIHLNSIVEDLKTAVDKLEQRIDDLEIIHKKRALQDKKTRSAES